MTTLAQRLGFADDERVVIVTCDEFGLSHASNEGCLAALDGVATSASLLVPAPWSRSAVAYSVGLDVGVGLTLNSPFDRYRWGPITHAPSLLDGDGGFPRTLDDSWDHADLDEVRRECRAQIERAGLWGLEVSHVSSYLDAMLLRPEFFDIYVDLALEFELPVRIAGPAAEQGAGFRFRQLASEEGLWFPDELIELGSAGIVGRLIEVTDSLEPGVTEIVLRPCVDSPEARAIGAEWGGRVADLAHLSDPGPLAELLESRGVKTIGWRMVRDALRSAG
ncbi:MAG: ChbG/HpnK family deacetylase [Microthrixaceae bacterium]